jgi:hypothetical protein
MTSVPGCLPVFRPLPDHYFSAHRMGFQPRLTCRRIHRFSVPGSFQGAFQPHRDGSPLYRFC